MRWWLAGWIYGWLASWMDEWVGGWMGCWMDGSVPCVPKVAGSNPTLDAM